MSPKPKQVTNNEDYVGARVPLDVKSLLQAEAAATHTPVSILIAKILTAYARGGYRMPVDPPESEVIRRVRREMVFYIRHRIKEFLLDDSLFPDMDGDDLRRALVKINRHHRHPKRIL